MRYLQFLFKKHKQFVKFRKIIEYNYNKYIAKFIKCGIIYEIRHTVKQQPPTE